MIKGHHFVIAEHWVLLLVIVSVLIISLIFTMWILLGAPIPGDKNYFGRKKSDEEIYRIYVDSMSSHERQPLKQSFDD